MTGTSFEEKFVYKNNHGKNQFYALCKKCPYSELLFWSTFSGIRSEYGEIFRISPYSARMRKSADQNNSEQGNFLRSDAFFKIAVAWFYRCENVKKKTGTK